MSLNSQGNGTEFHKSPYKCSGGCPLMDGLRNLGWRVYCGGNGNLFKVSTEDDTAPDKDEISNENVLDKENVEQIPDPNCYNEAIRRGILREDLGDIVEEFGDLPSNIVNQINNIDFDL